MNLDYHPRRKLLADISMDELIRMRADGMSNKEIAQKTGACIATIYRYLGKQPDGIRYQRTAVEARSAEKPAPQTPNPRHDPRLCACSQVWQGKACRLDVNYIDRTVSIAPAVGVMWDITELQDVISDLVSLGRSLQDTIRN